MLDWRIITFRSCSLFETLKRRDTHSFRMIVFLFGVHLSSPLWWAVFQSGGFVTQQAVFLLQINVGKEGVVVMGEGGCRSVWGVSLPGSLEPRMFMNTGAWIWPSLEAGCLLPLCLVYNTSEKKNKID